MKIGIITFWDSQDNYGQLLQVFALQYYLKKENQEPFLIRYKKQIQKKNKWHRVLSLWKILSPLHLIMYIKYKQEQNKSKIFNRNYPRYFDEFREQHIKVSSKIFNSFDELKNYNWYKTDAFICGSDQIWSYSKVKDNLLAFFLQFVPKGKKMIAYAASFGRAQIPNDYKQMLPQFLEKFSAVGLREQSGVELCINAGRDDAVLVCDPTMLLNGSDYIHSIVKKEIIQNNTIFIYLLNWKTLFPKKEIKKFATKNSFKIQFFGAHGIENKKLFPMVDDLSIPSWLEKMASSKIVFTNSFHGTVMAILFKKEFITFPLTGNSSKMNGRIYTLLKRLGLENRIFSKEKSVDEILNNPISWEKVNKKLIEFRNESEQFLKTALSYE